MLMSAAIATNICTICYFVCGYIYDFVFNKEFANVFMKVEL